jgi:hypothetical protein
MCARTQGSARGPLCLSTVPQPLVHSHGRVLSHLLSSLAKSVRNMPTEEMAPMMIPCGIVWDIISTV